MLLVKYIHIAHIVIGTWGHTRDKSHGCRGHH